MAGAECLPAPVLFICMPEMSVCAILPSITFMMHHSYHNNRWNQLLHFFFVPLILWSVAVWGCYSGALPSGPYTPKLPFQPELHIPDFISR